MSDENKNSQDPKSKPEGQGQRINEGLGQKINEGFNKADRTYSDSGDINKGFTYELKPQKPAEKPKTDGGTTTSE
ncbi:MAG: hypothetical protein JNL60_09390 [Bacteroidia bacterium]|nr:hypothetical protein [Bacteroidia bacterium]